MHVSIGKQAIYFVRILWSEKFLICRPQALEKDNLAVYLSVCLSVCLSVSLFVSLFDCLFVALLVCVIFYLSICLCVYLSVVSSNHVKLQSSSLCPFLVSIYSVHFSVRRFVL
jgi:hypothetical protein